MDMSIREDVGSTRYTYSHYVVDVVAVDVSVGTCVALAGCSKEVGTVHTGASTDAELGCTHKVGPFWRPLDIVW